VASNRSAVSLTKWDAGCRHTTESSRTPVCITSRSSRTTWRIIFVVKPFHPPGKRCFLPYIIHKYTGQEVWSLAAGELFKGRMGQIPAQYRDRLHQRTLTATRSL